MPSVVDLVLSKKRCHFLFNLGVLGADARHHPASLFGREDVGQSGITAPDGGVLGPSVCMKSATVCIPEDIVALFVILSTENSSSSSIFGF